MLFKRTLLTLALTATSIFAEDINVAVATKLQTKFSELNKDSENSLIKHHLTSLSHIFKIEEMAQSLNKNDKQVKKFNKVANQCLEWLPEKYNFEAVRQGNNRLIFSFVSKTDHTIQTYALRLPQNYDKDKTYPLIVELHGMGPGTHFQFISWEFKKIFNTKREGVLSAYVLEPFGRGNNYYQGFAENDIFEAITDMKRFFKVDEDRTYLKGQSMGGGGAWHIATGTPDFWAAVSLNCPAFYAKQDSFRAENLSGVPTRFWYGGKDKPYYGESARTASKKLNELGYESEVHISPEAGHKMPALERIKIDKWLLTHKRPVPKKFSYKTNSRLYGSKGKKSLFRCGRNGIYISPYYDEERILKSFICGIDGNTIKINTKNCKELQIFPQELKIKGKYIIILNGKEVYNGKKRKIIVPVNFSEISN